MANRPTIIVIAFVAGAAIFALAPGLSTSVQRMVGIGSQTKPAVPAKPAAPEPSVRILPMSEERIELAQIDQRSVGPATIAKHLAVLGTIVPDAGRVAHVSVKLAGTVAELRKNIGDDVVKDEVIAVLESREVADAKSEYLAARLSNEHARRKAGFRIVDPLRRKPDQPRERKAPRRGDRGGARS